MADIIRDGAVIAGLFFNYFVRLMLPLAVVGVLAALFGNIIQVGFLFSVKPITPDFKKVIPHFGQYFQRTIFSMEGLYNLGRSILKITVICVVAWIVVNGELGKLRNLYFAPIWTSVKLVAGMIIRLVISVAVTLLALSIPDYMFQKRQFMERMKMTKQEVKEERKMHEGDPQVKGRLRERMRDLLTRNMAVNVPKADVVITNPTHFAVAIEWDRESMAAPMVTAKGQDEVALRIRRIAKDAKVPVVENRPLARALYAETRDRAGDSGEILPGHRSGPGPRVRPERQGSAVRPSAPAARIWDENQRARFMPGGGLDVRYQRVLRETFTDQPLRLHRGDRRRGGRPDDHHTRPDDAPGRPDVPEPRARPAHSPHRPVYPAGHGVFHLPDHAARDDDLRTRAQHLLDQADPDQGREVSTAASSGPFRPSSSAPAAPKASSSASSSSSSS